MATLATVTEMSNNTVFTGGIGVNTADVVVQTGDASRFDEFLLGSLTGAMKVYVSLDGTNYFTAELSLIDLGAIIGDPVIVTVANRTYAFFGSFSKIQVKQSGAPAVTGATLRCSKKGGVR